MFVTITKVSFEFRIDPDGNLTVLAMVPYGGTASWYRGHVYAALSEKKIVTEIARKFDDEFVSPIHRIFVGRHWMECPNKEILDWHQR